MPRIDVSKIEPSNATGYPAPFDRDVAGRWWRRIAPAGGLTEMGASHVVLSPGGWSSQRHWHKGEDELLVMLSGEAALVEDGSRTVLRAGDICSWAKGIPNGHHLINDSEAECSFIAISAGPNLGGEYPDIDMQWDTHDRYLHKDGSPYPAS